MKRGISSLGWFPFGWFVVFLAVPLGLILATSFAARGPYGGVEWSFSLANYVRALDPLYGTILIRSLVLASATTLACLVIGFPMALVMASAAPRVRALLVILLAVPFLTNLLIRVCSLKVITAYEGPLAWLLGFFIENFDPFVLSQNLPLVFYGMITSYLPFMVFPIYSALERFDFSLIEAAEDLGASYSQAVFRVVVPALKGAIISGSLLVFVPAIGEFAIPDLLGGAKAMLVGNLISEQFLKARDWPFGAALAMFVIVALSVMVFAARKLSDRRSS